VPRELETSSLGILGIIICNSCRHHREYKHIEEFITVRELV